MPLIIFLFNNNNNNNNNNNSDCAALIDYNVETSYFTQLKENVLPSDNVSMSVGHLDQVLIVYSWMEHVTWKSPGPVCG